MNLKKSDKMIAVVAVVILIIAAIGIVLYVDKEPDEIEPIIKEYAVKWIRGEESDVIEGSVGKDGYTEPFTVTASETDSVITKVDVLITWDDDYTKGKFFNKGEDTVTTNIALAGEDPKEYTDEGIGNGTLSFSVYSMPQDKTIEDAKDITEAEQIISEEYKDMNSADFDVDVTWEKGENLLTLRIVKLINYFRDKGEDFKFEVTFEYYYPDVYEVGEDSEEDDGNGGLQETGTSTVQTYCTLGLPGKN